MNKVKAYASRVVIPTYKPDDPTPLPMFFDKRVYQGASGRVYPHNVVEGVSDTKQDAEYTAVYLENEYLLVMILPELGGRIQRILDKTNSYDAVYYNEVIKPALVGMTGPWISGGIEFNWPQHHRPTTLMPLDYTIEENADGSATVWVSEVEQMFHTKGMAGYTLYPGKAYLEVKGQLYNPNDYAQTFLWWANPAVAVNENTQSVFPPDVHYVLGNGRREASKFPIATGIYNKMDYSEGVDISRSKNIPIPTTYTACRSNYDFIGNYDHGKNAGLLHIADHHISPGKKQWTWGSDDFGEKWIENLTDDNGAYVELMAGVFTGDQPEFSFIAPYEEKSFKQYFMPYKNIGAVKNASLSAVINLEVKDKKAIVKVYSPSELKASVTLGGGPLTKYFRESVVLDPLHPYEREAELEDADIEDNTRLSLCVYDENDELIVQYSPLPEVSEKLPKPAQKPKKPEEIASMEELFLAASHIEQYRHATLSPEPYYLEGLRRDPGDLRLNNGYGKFLYKRGEFKKAEKHFRAAIERATMFNPNPYDCEPFYNLGTALKKQQRFDEAYDAFYKSIWDSSMCERGYYQLACICARREQYDAALGFAERSIERGVRNLYARNLKTALLRLTDHPDEARAVAEETRRIDPLDTGCRYELYKISNNFEALNELTQTMRGNLHNYIELSLFYAESGLYGEAAKVLALISNSERPMLHYYMAYYSNSQVELEIAAKCRDIAFPNRLTDILVLKYAIKNNPEDPLAPYLLGCLLYDKGRYKDAIEAWERSLQLAPREAATHRNLAIAYYNKKHNTELAVEHMERAARFAPDNARIYFECDRLRKLTGVSPKKRVKDMNNRLDMVKSRDDLYTEYITLLNSLRYYRKALKAISLRRFHPNEGSEGKISGQYRKACIGIAREHIAEKDYEGAIDILKAALTFPENLGEGKLSNALDNDIYYLLGCAYEKIDLIEANSNFAKAALCDFNFVSAARLREVEPEMIYYSALALEKLDHHSHAVRRFRRLVNYYEENYDDKCEIDYFAVSLPEFYVFDADLDRNNFVRCCYIGALGYMGLNERSKAAELINAGLEKDPSNQELLELRDMDESPVESESPEIDGGYFKAASW